MNRREFLSLHSKQEPVSHSKTSSARVGAGPSLSALEPFIPTVEAPWNYARAAHMLRRVMSGPKDEEIRRAVREGLEATVERILEPFEPSVELISGFAWNEPNTGPPEPEGPLYDTWVWEKLGRRYRLAQWCAKAMIDSPVSIQERMTFFWHDHFTTHMGKVEFAEYEFINNQTLRAHALGNFKEMTRAVTKDPGMLIYLDGETNTRFTPNENYGRELLELFTIGRVDREGKPNYTQQDVSEVARALTGWQQQQSMVLPDTHRSVTSIFWHHLWDDGPKTFLGRKGNWNADDVIGIIFEVRANEVAQFICGKIYQLLVSLTPDHRAIDEMAATFRQNDWEIRPVLRQLLRSSHFLDVQNIGCLPKNLLDFYVGMIRSMELQRIPDFAITSSIVPYRDLFFRLERYDQLPFHPPNVSGWPKGRAWVSPAALAPRIRFARDVARGKVEPTHMKWWEDSYSFDAILFARTFPQPNDLQSLCDDMALFFLGVPPSSEERKMLLDALLDGGVEYEWDLDNPDERADLRIRLFLEQLFALPKFQLY